MKQKAAGLLKGRARIGVIVVVITIAMIVFSHNVHIAYAIEDDIVYFPDASLKQALMDTGTDTSGDGEISKGEMAALTCMLDFSGRNISDISGLQYAVNIEGLNLYATDVRDITILASLTNLTYLNLGYNYLTDDCLPDLEALTSMEYLYLAHNGFYNISPLQNMTHLKELDLSYNNVTSIDALSGMYELETLNINYCKVMSINSLADKSSLTTINVSSNYLNPNDAAGDMAILGNIENVSGAYSQYKIKVTYNGGLYGTPERSTDSVYHGDTVIMPELTFDTSFIVYGWDVDGDGVADVAEGASFIAETPFFANRYNATYNAVYERDYTWPSGSGTEQSPYLVSTPQQVNEIRYFPDACFLLTNDIDMAAVTSEGGEFYCEGAGWNPIYEFNGILDGNGYKISGLSSSRDKTSFVITIGEPAEIRNLTLDDIYMEGEDCASGICHENNGLITNCVVSGYIAQTTADISTYNGGIAGINYGTISFCKVSGTVTALDDNYLVGGIAAYNGGLIEYSVNAATVKAVRTCGGISDRNDATINACYNTGNIFGGTTCGGIVGDSKLGSIIANCYNTGHNYGGGIAGKSAGSVSNCYNIGIALGMGIIEDVYGGTVTNCYAIENASGIINSNGDVSTVKSLTNEEMLLQDSFSGFDFNNVWTMDGESNFPYPELQQVSMTTPPDNSTDFAGGNGLPYNPYRIVTALHLNNVRYYAWDWFELQNDIDLAEATRAGGAFYHEGYGWTPIGDTNDNFYGVFDGNLHNIIGLYGSGMFNELKDCSTVKNLGIARADIKGSGIICMTNYGYIVQCYTSGDVTNSGAGLARENRGLISNCYSSANIFGDYVGGLVDCNYGVIEYCYSSGNISATVPLNGDLVRRGSTENSCYHLLNAKAASGGEEANPGIELAEQEFRQQESFDLLNFSSIWTMAGDSDYPYPEIQGLQHIERPDNSIDFAGGNGMQYDPYLISTVENLNNMKCFCMSNYSLQKDIDLGGAEWEPFEFYGNFEGNNHVISNGSIIASYWYEGFFGSVNDSTISNLGIEDFSIVSEYNTPIGTSPKYVGLFAGKSYYSRITNCYATGSINCIRGSKVGGFTGSSNSKIVDCYANASIVGEDEVGGFIGFLWDDMSIVSDEYCETINCYFTGEVKGKYSIGGFTGVSSGEVYVLDCYSVGEVTGAGFVGEFIGNTDPECIYNNCYWYSSANSDSIGAGSDIIGAGSTVLISKIIIPEIDDVDINIPVASSELTTNFALFGDPVSIAFIQTKDPSIAIIESEQLKGVSLGSTGVDLLVTYADERVVRLSGYKINISGIPLVSVIGVTLDSSELFVHINDIIMLTATVLPEDATNKNVSWLSNDESIATVEDGVVTAVAPGTATITVTTEDGGLTDTCTVTVIQHVTSVSLSSNTETMITGDSLMLSVTVLPTGATYPQVTWQSSNVDIATVDQTGKVTAIAPGSATITATADGVSDTCVITVEKKAVTSVSLSCSAETMIAGNSLTLLAAVLPSDATYSDIIWQSSNTDVATVDQTGKVTAVAPGSVTITATADGISETCEITVQAATFNVMSTPSNTASGSTAGGSTYPNGESVTLTATPSAGYRFVCWKNGSTQVSTSAAYTFIASADVSLTAEFALIGTPSPSAASGGYNSVNISWSAVEGAAGYEVWQATSSTGPYTKLGATTGTVYTDTGLSTGTTYYYKVNAYCTASTAVTYGAQSTYVSAKPIPSAPVSPAAVMAGYNSVRVSWNAVEGVSGYRVYRATSANGTYSYVCSGTSSLSYTNTYLSTGKTYYYKVRAYRYVSGSRVYGDYSDAVSATPVLSPVTSATASAYYPTSVKVSWSSVPGRTKYEVWRSTAENGEYTLIGTTSYTYYKNTGLTPFVTYFYKIRVYRSVSRQKVYGGDFSPIASATPILNDVTNVAAASYSSSSVKVSWSAVTGASGYEVWRSDTADGEYTLIKSTTYKYYTNTNLEPNRTHYYKVVAYRTVGNVRIYSAESEPVSAAPYLGPVTNAKAVRSSSTKIKLTWSAVSGRTGYEIYRSEAPDGEFVSIGTTRYTYYYSGGLTTGVPYYYKIRAYKTVNGVRYYSQELAGVTAVSATP